MKDRHIILIGLVGTVFFSFGVYLLYDTVGFVSRSRETMATVINFDVSKEGNYFPIFQFKDDGGSTVTARSTSGSKPPAYSIGDKVSILYDPQNPTNIRVNSIIFVWLPPIFSTIMGMLAISIAIESWRRYH